jgi:hypothetical protein
VSLEDMTPGPLREMLLRLGHKRRRVYTASTRGSTCSIDSISGARPPRPGPDVSLEDMTPGPLREMLLRLGHKRRRVYTASTRGSTCSIESISGARPPHWLPGPTCRWRTTRRGPRCARCSCGSGTSGGSCTRRRREAQPAQSNRLVERDLGRARRVLEDITPRPAARAALAARAQAAARVHGVDARARDAVPAHDRQRGPVSRT